jgi:hypothetical protein
MRQLDRHTSSQTSDSPPNNYEDITSQINPRVVKLVKKIEILRDSDSPDDNGKILEESFTKIRLLIEVIYKETVLSSGVERAKELREKLFSYTDSIKNYKLEKKFESDKKA